MHGRLHPACIASASTRGDPNPRARIGETSDPQPRERRQAACQHAMVADGRPRHGRGTWLAPLQGAGGDGDRRPVVLLRSTTGYLLRDLRFRARDPMRPVLRGAKASFPCIGMPGFSERVTGWGPWDPSVGYCIRVQGRNREPKSFLLGDQEAKRPLATRHALRKRWRPCALIRPLPSSVPSSPSCRPAKALGPPTSQRRAVGGRSGRCFPMSR